MMEYLLNPYSAPIETFAYWENEFSQQELDFLQEKALNSTERAKVGRGISGQSLLNIRRSQVSWIKYSNDMNWIFEKLSHIVSSLNSRFFRFDLTGFGEALQLTNYDQSEQGMYDWHLDYGTGISRKLSVVLQLTDPSEYEGGNLQLSVSGKPTTITKQRGLVVVFPSYTLHQVTPVTQGSRQSLVSWISGPAFR